MANISPGVVKSPSEAIKVSVNRKYQHIARFKNEITYNYIQTIIYYIFKSNIGCRTFSK